MTTADADTGPKQALHDLSNRAFQTVFSPGVRKRVERTVMAAAVAGFLLHLALYAVHAQGFIEVPAGLEELFQNPISAVYTPFSLILVYEVFLLLYYLPLSFTESVAKQYEIIALIVIRKVFMDLSDLELSGEEIFAPANVEFFADMVGIPALFGLILLFERVAASRPKADPTEEVEAFVRWKEALSVLLVPVLALISVVTVGGWIHEIVLFEMGTPPEGGLTDVNQVFYDDFFTALILVDVLILLLSFIFTDSYEQLLRNAGFVVSTILIRLSFNAGGLLDIALEVGGVAFGLSILWLYKQARRTDLLSVEEVTETVEKV